MENGATWSPMGYCRASVCTCCNNYKPVMLHEGAKTALMVQTVCMDPAV